MYVISQNIPAELRIDFEKVFLKNYKARYATITDPLKRRQELRPCSTHIYTWAAPPPWKP
jgi:hypothetical protein